MNPWTRNPQTHSITVPHFILSISPNHHPVPSTLAITHIQCSVGCVWPMQRATEWLRINFSLALYIISPPLSANELISSTPLLPINHLWNASVCKIARHPPWPSKKWSVELCNTSGRRSVHRIETPWLTTCNATLYKLWWCTCTLGHFARINKQPREGKFRIERLCTESQIINVKFDQDLLLSR